MSDAQRLSDAKRQMDQLAAGGTIRWLKPDETLDPLLAALIAKLPESRPAHQRSPEWPLGDRIAWLEMMAMAFTLTHGDVGKISVEPAHSPRDSEASRSNWQKPDFENRTGPVVTIPTKVAPPLHSGYDFYVDRYHFVRRANPEGQRVLADEAVDQEIYDYRPRGSDGRDHASVIWADDTTGAKPGMTFCGPG